MQKSYLGIRLFGSKINQKLFSERVDFLKKEIDNLGAGISKNKSATNDVNTKAQVNEKEIQLLKLQIQEIQIKSKNPLGG